MTPIERAAAAYCERVHGPYFWKNAAEPGRSNILEGITTAIQALREPTDEMLEAAHFAASFRVIDLDEDDAEALWQAMIDGLLEEV